MAETALVNLEVEAGRRLVEAIRTAGIPLEAAAWVFDSERARWKLHLVAAWPVQVGDNPYRAISHFFSDDRPEGGATVFRGIKLEDVVLHFPTSPLAKALRQLGAQTARMPHRMSDRYVGGVFFEDAVVYPVAA